MELLKPLHCTKCNKAIKDIEKVRYILEETEYDNNYNSILVCPKCHKEYKKRLVKGGN